MEALEQILEKRQLRAKRGDFPFIPLFEKLARADLVIDHVQQVGNGRDALRMKSEARRQFIVSLVTALETYLGDLVVEMIDGSKVKLRKKAIEGLSKKYNLMEIHQIIKNKLTVGELVCDNINFQSLPSAMSFLSKLFNRNFPKLLEENKFQFENKFGRIVTIYLRKGSIKTLQEIFDLRHKFVHDVSFNNTPPYARLKFYKRLVLRFVACIDVHADQSRGVKNSKIIKK